MNDFMDLPREGQAYDHAAQMRKLRGRKKKLGVGPVNAEIAIAERMWWHGQIDVATAARLESAVSRDPSLMEEVANLGVKERAKLDEAALLLDKADEHLKPLARDHQQAVLTQLRHKKEGQEAVEMGDTNLVTKHYAMEYISYVRARGYKRLIRYYMEGGVKPRIVPDV